MVYCDITTINNLCTIYLSPCVTFATHKNIFETLNKVVKFRDNQIIFEYVGYQLNIWFNTSAKKYYDYKLYYGLNDFTSVKTWIG